MSKKEIKCLRTWYNGIFFRSRTEARTAILQDCLGLKHGYEEESYSNNGTNYLPDFHLLQRVRVEVDNNEFEYWDDVFWEVKGREELSSQYERDKIVSFINDGGHKLYISGKLSCADSLDGIYKIMSDKAEEIPWIFNLYNINCSDKGGWLAYPGRSKSGEFTFYQTPDSPDMDRLWTYKAYSLALNAQFEHGKKPKIKLTEKGPVNLQDLAENADPEPIQPSKPKEKPKKKENLLSRIPKKKTPKDKHISVFITPADYQDVKEISQVEDASVNGIINTLLRDFIDDYKNGKYSDSDEPVEYVPEEQELNPVEFQDDLADKINEYEEMLVNPSPQTRSLNLRDLGLMDKRKNRSHRISIYVTEDIYQELQDLKKQKGVSVNSMLNAAIALLLKDNQQYLQDLDDDEDF